jgi:hypothetical protein
MEQARVVCLPQTLHIGWDFFFFLGGIVLVAADQQAEQYGLERRNVSCQRHRTDETSVTLYGI